MQISFTFGCYMSFPLNARPGGRTARKKHSPNVKTFRTFQPSGGSKSTYGLHLAHWAGSLPIELKFMCAKYQAGLDPQLYQALEDALWDEMSPMFGRRGAK
jgi:hypothetical protein